MPCLSGEIPRESDAKRKYGKFFIFHISGNSTKREG
jgi:hypothetical protein